MIMYVSHPVCINIKMADFLQNRIIFDSVDKLSPVSKMADSCLKKC